MIAAILSIFAVLIAAIFHTGKKLAASESKLRQLNNSLELHDLDTAKAQQELAVSLLDEKRRQNEEEYRRSFDK